MICTPKFDFAVHLCTVWLIEKPEAFSCQLLAGTLLDFIWLSIAVVASQLQDAVGDEVFSCSITLNNSLNQVLRHIGIVCQQLLGILRQAVSTGRCQVLDNIFHK